MYKDFEEKQEKKVLQLLPMNLKELVLLNIIMKIDMKYASLLNNKELFIQIEILLGMLKLWL